jgi:hypothetical protein
MRDAFPKKTKDTYYFSMEKERALFENGRRPKHFLGGQNSALERAVSKYTSKMFWHGFY